MLWRMGGLALVLLALAVGTTAGQEKKQDVKEVVGKVKEVDTKKKQFTIILADKSDRIFLVNKDTKFTGPRGADHEEGLRDEGMAKGSEVRVVPASDEKLAQEVKLPPRKKGKDAKGG